MPEVKKGEGEEIGRVAIGQSHELWLQGVAACAEKEYMHSYTTQRQVTMSTQMGGVRDANLIALDCSNG